MSRKYWHCYVHIEKLRFRLVCMLQHTPSISSSLIGFQHWKVFSVPHIRKPIYIKIWDKFVSLKFNAKMYSKPWWLFWIRFLDFHRISTVFLHQKCTKSDRKFVGLSFKRANYEDKPVYSIYLMLDWSLPVCRYSLWRIF